MTDHPRETLARIRAQADEATDGPWEAEQPPGPGEDPMRSICVYPQEGGGAIAYVQPLEADAEFIAHARTTVPALLDLADAVLDLADQLDAEQEAMHDFYSWPRDDSERPEAPSARIRSTITTALEAHYA